MIDKDKMIEVVAKAIRDEAEKSEKDWDGVIAIRTSKRESKRYAKAAIKAFCKELPQLNKEDYDDLAQYCNESKLCQR